MNTNTKVWWDDDNGILRIKEIGYYDESDASDLAEKTLIIANKHPGLISSINDMRLATGASLKARAVFLKLITSERFNKQSFFGAPTLTKFTLEIIANLSTKGNVRHFDTEAEALKWLKE